MEELLPIGIAFTEILKLARYTTEKRDKQHMMQKQGTEFPKIFRFACLGMGRMHIYMPLQFSKLPFSLIIEGASNECNSGYDDATKRCKEKGRKMPLRLHDNAS